MKEVDKWAANIDERRTIESFWEWLLSQNDGTTGIYDVHIGNALDKYHGINKTKLEEERRQILENHRAQTYSDHTCGQVRRRR